MIPSATVVGYKRFQEVDFLYHWDTVVASVIIPTPSLGISFSALWKPFSAEARIHYYFRYLLYILFINTFTEMQY